MQQAQGNLFERTDGVQTVRTGQGGKVSRSLHHILQRRGTKLQGNVEEVTRHLFVVVPYHILMVVALL